ncbi:plasmid mobilization protein [Thiofilum flexile]|uniref:plasmid mobilization protein n=1 Tax=Thiofilum flexile TaxID=125627 RepID=UPI00037D6F93|nr:plasmid mobilization relaxosome protein MobC [Thiofilum flexile]
MNTTENRQAYKKAWNQKNKSHVKRVSITLSNSEYSELEKRAKKENIKITTLVKNMALAYHQQAPLFSSEQLQEMQEMRFLFRNIANNINQIAHNSNMIKRLTDENGLLLEIKKLEDIVMNYYQKPKA